jgi:hypothetical protein
MSSKRIGKWWSPPPLAEQDPLLPHLGRWGQDRAAIAAVGLELGREGGGRVPSGCVVDRDPVALHGDLLLRLVLDGPVGEGGVTAVPPGGGVGVVVVGVEGVGGGARELVGEEGGHG